MRRLLRIGLIVALLASVVGWAGSAHGVAAQGTSYSDAMDSEATGLLNSQSPDPARFFYGYQNGQFVIQSTQQGWNGDLYAFAGVPQMADATVAVDFYERTAVVRVAGEINGN